MNPQDATVQRICTQLHMLGWMIQTLTSYPLIVIKAYHSTLNIEKIILVFEDGSHL